jgi:hypothetical protein
MESSLENLIRISSDISRSHPALSKSLRLSTIRMAANPDSYRFEDRLQGLVVILKSIQQDLERSLKEVSGDDFNEFKKFFKGEFEAEQEQIKQILDGIRTPKTAGPADFFKGLFKKKPKPIPNPVEDSVSDSSYSMSDYDMDSFVDGKTEWGDSSEYVEKEYKENQKFFTRVKNFMNKIGELKINPSKEMVRSAISVVRSIIQEAESLIKGSRSSLDKKPEPTLTLEDDSNSPPGKSPPKKKIDLENTVNHYADMLLESASDEQKSLRLLKELFSKVGPYLEEDRASLASSRLAHSLVRVASSSPRTRHIILPIIRKIIPVGL